jgi:microcystin degradation protein MlrC
MPALRIGILGFAIECNRFAPVSTREDFVRGGTWAGDALTAEARREAPAIMAEIPAFYRTMDAAGPWQPVPLIFTHAEPGGPVDHHFFKRFLAELGVRLDAAGKLDGVYICEHGAAITTEEHDPDGAVFELIRARVGKATPIVATLDLHANVSTRMVDEVDALIVYRCNPHTDMAERGAEAAAALRELVGGVRTATAQIRLPIVSPQVALLTAKGAGPYADLMDYAQAQRDDRILNISVVGGFSYGDTPKNGLTVLVTTRGDAALAERVARDIAERGWADRARYRAQLTSLDDAVAWAVRAGEDATLPSLCLADVADNPGGGGRGNTVWLLEALHRAGAQGVLLGVFNDAVLAEEAHRRGESAEFDAVFNRAETTEFSTRFTARARVLKLSDGKGIGRRGLRVGRSFALGRSAALAVGGMTIVVISDRQQCLDPRYFEMFGLDVARARTVVVKSRGHFRAGFDEFFRPEQIVEVDAPGLTSPNLATFPWRHLPRPVLPLDGAAEWHRVVHVRPARDA